MPPFDDFDVYGQRQAIRARSSHFQARVDGILARRLELDALLSSPSTSDA